MKILVAYYSRSGHTKEMAQAIAKGVRNEGVECDLRDISEVNVDDLLDYDALLFGSPTYYGQMAAELKKLFDDSVKHHGKLTGKIGGAFTSSGMVGGGGETTIFSIIHALLIHGMIIVGDAEMQHYGPLAIELPDEEAVKKCVKYGQKTAALTKKIT
ncbi:MAG: NAD(P)H-dependent oxidoreductase [candidate division WOR-3 bacterium]|nr:MAG: NAD(P)H-dependent oxidoreductase [candidate division WOR-3 bacterium]